MRRVMNVTGKGIMTGEVVRCRRSYCEMFSADKTADRREEEMRTAFGVR